MKLMKYSGLYLMIVAIGYSFLNFVDASDVWIGFFMGGNILYYTSKLWDKDS